MIVRLLLAVLIALVVTWLFSILIDPIFALIIGVLAGVYYFTRGDLR